MLHVLGTASSINVRKVLWTCDEIGLEYRLEDWGGSGASPRQPEFLALNPNGLVPVLIDAEHCLWESNTICRYLAFKHNRCDLLPNSPFERAKVEQWMDWQATELNGAWRYAFMGLVRKSPDHQDPVQIEASIAAWTHKMAIFDQQLMKTGAYATGPHFTLADIGLGLSVNRWMKTDLKRPAFSSVATYYARLEARATFLPYSLV